MWGSPSSKEARSKDPLRGGGEAGEAGPGATQKTKPTAQAPKAAVMGQTSPTGVQRTGRGQKGHGLLGETRTHPAPIGRWKETHLMEEGKYSESLSFPKYMFGEGHGDKPDTVTCTRWIEKLINLGDIEEAVRLMEMLEKYGEPDIFAYITLISGLCRVNRMDLADKAFEEMISRGLAPEAVLCTRMIQGFFNSKNIQKAVRIMEILEEHGEPDVFAYNVLIGELCKVNRIDLANKFLDRMGSSGFSPNVVTYNTMIGRCCSRRKLDLAFKVLDRMLNDKCEP
ncbi:hypothetical protein SLA2020_307640 [Shorea laevis]